MGGCANRNNRRKYQVLRGPESACIPPAYSACFGSSLEVRALAMARVVVCGYLSPPKEIDGSSICRSMRDVVVGCVLSK